jgi:epoxyqueuosine reductase
MTAERFSQQQLKTIADDIRRCGSELGFQHIGITDIDLAKHQTHLQNWLAKNFHGEMAFMAKHGDMRSHPEQLVPGTLRVISARLDYLPDNDQSLAVLINPNKAYVSRYALGRDYHKLMRKRLAKLALNIQDIIGSFNYRALVDSAPVLERGLAEKAGLGWIGKNTMLISSDAGSWFFLGEIYTDLPLPVDLPQETMHCGSCTACLDECPTGAIIGPHQVDARKCISYLTIELRGSIPEELRPLMGNRIYGCDDCQLVCPWNKFADTSTEDDFQARHNLNDSELLSLFAWTKEEFLQRTEGSAIRRIGYDCWQRNIAIALGNAPFQTEIIKNLQSRYPESSPMVQEHIEWALQQQAAKSEL